MIYNGITPKPQTSILVFRQIAKFKYSGNKTVKYMLPRKILFFFLKITFNVKSSSRTYFMLLKNIYQYNSILLKPENLKIKAVKL